MADLLVSIPVLVVLIVPMLLLGILVKATSQGPVLFKQQRIGKGGHPFMIYKFRTMGTDAPSEMATTNLDNPEQYVTRLGHYLRQMSIDELPQLLNVIKGDMSIVGPRPLIMSEAAINRERHRLKIDRALPGITGWAQVNGRDMISNNEKVAYDLAYYANISFAMDAKIILLTIKQVLKHQDIKG